MRILKALLSTSALVIFLFPPALGAPPGPPGAHVSIVQVFVDDPNDPTSIVIIGEDLLFGKGPVTVTLGEFIDPLVITGMTDTEITALLPESIDDGDYLLTVSNGTGQSQNDEYDLTIGAVGPQGPKGDAGADGEDGARGPAGADGEQGPQGEQGMQGPIGMTGATGADGADGADGDDGADGAQGPPGTATATILASCSGSGVVSCTCPVSHPFLMGGACQKLSSFLPGFAPSTSIFGSPPDTYSCVAVESAASVQVDIICSD